MANGDNNGAPSTSCPMGIDNHRRIVTLEKADEQVWQAIEEIRRKLDRLPAWGVALISALSALSGGAVATAVQIALSH